MYLSRQLKAFNMKKIFRQLTTSVLLGVLTLPIVPNIAFAQPSTRGGMRTPPVSDFKSLVAMLVQILDTALVSIMALTFLYVAWTLVNAWVIHGDDPKSQEKGKSTAIAGVVALVVLISLWGIVGFVRSILGR